MRGNYFCNAVLVKTDKVVVVQSINTVMFTHIVPYLLHLLPDVQTGGGTS